MNNLHIIALTSGKLRPFTSSLRSAPRQYRAFALLLIAAVVGVCVATQADSLFSGVFCANAAAFALNIPAHLGLTHALDTIAVSATAPGSSGAAGAAVGTDSLVVKNSKGARIVKMWGDYQTAGFAQVVSPSGHDTTRNYRSRVRADALNFIEPEGLALSVQAQETLSVTIAGSATAGDVEQLIMAMVYDSLPGTAQRLCSWSTLVKKAKRFTTIDLTLTGAAAGYTGSETIATDSDLLQSNQDYAVLGAFADVNVTVILQGPDTANLKVAIPIFSSDPEACINYFPRISREMGMPLIPVINSGNKTNTFASFLQDENNISPKVTFYLAQLGSLTSQEA